VVVRWSTAGNVLGRYVAGLSRFPGLAIRGCAARSADRARAAAAKLGISAYDSIAALLDAPDLT
jgi:predicted dehydrogenase